MVTAGVTPMQALLASTSTAATACGVDGQVGSIQAGKGADIVIVAGSPLGRHPCRLRRAGRLQGRCARTSHTAPDDSRQPDRVAAVLRDYFS
jgi:predicted amidohydrolase YtcJ